MMNTEVKLRQLQGGKWRQVSRVLKVAPKNPAGLRLVDGCLRRPPIVIANSSSLFYFQVGYPCLQVSVLLPVDKSCSLSKSQFMAYMPLCPSVISYFPIFSVCLLHSLFYEKCDLKFRNHSCKFPVL